MKDKTILHIDVNNFFASVECIGREDLKDCPVAVAGTVLKRNGIILAKNQIAKTFGVSTGEAIWQAKEKCPTLIVLPPHYSKYKKISQELIELYLTYTDKVEPLGLDECWLDITESLSYLKKTPNEIAFEIKEKIKYDKHVTVSIGISFSKVMAKLGSDLKKPDAITIVSRINFKEILYPLPITAIIGIGRKNEKKFNKINVFKIVDILSIPDNILKKVFNISIVKLKAELSGIPIFEIIPFHNLPPEKSIGNGTTLISDIQTRAEIFSTISFLTARVSKRMEDAKVLGGVISVTLKTYDFKFFHHQTKIFPTFSSKTLAKDAINLVDTFFSYNTPIRAIRIKVSSLEKINKARQITMFDEDNISLENALSKVKNKYGYDSLTLASDLSPFINRDRKE